MSDRRTAVDMMSKTSNVSRAVEWNCTVYNIPDTKGWEETALDKYTVYYKDFSDDFLIDLSNKVKKRRT